MTLSNYIKQNYASQTEFAKSQGVSKQHVQKWLKAGYIVVDDVMYSKRRDIKTNS